MANANTLFFGDNLPILRHHSPDEVADLIYLDPPFNSNQNYNVLFAEQDGTRAAAQIKAFGDTWRWDRAAVEAFTEVVEGGGRVSQAMQAFRTLLGDSNMLAYLAMMAPRLLELHRVLKATGSLYLHCDPTASHYLKILLDSVFGPRTFRNEIIWRRTGAHNKLRRYGPIHDTLLFYTKTDGNNFTWNFPKKPYMNGHVAEYFVQDDKGYRTNYYGNVLTGSGLRGGESGKPWRGFDPSAKNRHWAIPGGLLAELDEDISELGQHEKLDYLYERGNIKIVPGQAWPIYEHYITPRDGTLAPDIWAYQPYTNGTVFGSGAGIDEDVRWLSTKDQERLGYPTQKPESLLGRIIGASSNEGDLILDPFCGCGTTVTVAQAMKRRWVGIDITHIAIHLIKVRLADRFGADAKYEVIGEPVSLSDAKALAASDPYGFQWWALGRVGARGIERKKGADKGIDGRLYFHDEGEGGRTKQIIFSVKAGHIEPSYVRDLSAVVAREDAQIGVLISLNKPTQPMRTEAASAGFYSPPGLGKEHRFPKIQLLTIEELLGGSGIDYPRYVSNVTFKKATRTSAKAKASTLPLPLTAALPSAPTKIRTKKGK